MKHLNSNVLTVVEITMSGLNPEKHDIVEICMIPLDYQMRPHPEKLPFIAQIKPRRGLYDPEHITKNKIAEVLAKGHDPDFVINSMVDWFDRTKIKTFKQLMPVAYNWNLISGFLHDWMGTEEYNYIFSPYYRDLIPFALAMNDKCDVAFREFLYPKYDRTYIGISAGVKALTNHHNITDRAMSIAKIYKNMVYK